MDIFVILIILFSIGSLYFVFAKKAKKLDFTELLVFAISFYLVLIVLISFPLLFIGYFKPFIVFIIGFIVSGTLLFILNRKFSVGKLFVSENSLYLLIFLVVMIFLFASRYEFIEMYQDPGVYYVTAMNQLNEGTFELNLDVREKFSDQIKPYFDEDNFYRYSDDQKIFLPGTYFFKDGERAYFQGYSGWPLLLALSGGLLGMKYATYVMLLLYGLIVFHFNLITRKIVKEDWIALVLTFVFATSPLLAYFSRFPVSELFLLFLVLFLVDSFFQKKIFFVLCAILSTILFFFSHSSSLIYVLVLVFVFAYMIVKKDKNLALYFVFVLPFFVLSILYGYLLNYEYFIAIASYTFTETFYLYVIWGYVLISFVGAFYSFNIYRKLDEAKT